MEWRFDSQPKRMFFALESISRQQQQQQQPLRLQTSQLLLSMSFSMFFNGFYCSMYFLIKPHCFKSPYLVQKDKKWLIFTILHLCGHFSCLAYKKANVFCRRFFVSDETWLLQSYCPRAFGRCLRRQQHLVAAVLKKILNLYITPENTSIELGIQKSKGIVVQKE